MIATGVQAQLVDFLASALLYPDPTPIRRVHMDSHPPLSLSHHFQDLPDPRRGPLCDHDLVDIIAIAICAVICGQHAWTDIELYGETHHAWLKTFLRLPNGIPSHDTFRYLFARLDPAAFQRCFSSWIAALSTATGLKHIAFDGKTLCGSADRAHGQAALHLVSAWAAQNHLALGQVAVDTKSNEITAIPRLLAILDLCGAIVTIDAMGCQKDIARQLRDAGADYVLAVKDNQPRLLQDLQQTFAAHFEQAPAADPCGHQTVTRGHGRQEVRTYTLLTDLSGIRDRELWADLHAICMVRSERTIGEQTSTEVRYYVGSFPGTVPEYAEVIRGHWGIENTLHWVLDVTFREDASRARADHGAENLAWLRRMAVSLLKNDTTCQRSLRQKSIKALCDHEFLLQLLSQVSGYKEDA
jgi:predicted transposase YbfD/YdcC